ncbi:hypothetical protein QCA50_013498 [Cerrena zonata]|uniref:F-box domain-containing protein n=1 Tax=Cerrena zonata TaxID=2478898 RepID=A0AAW0G0T4_9APHY
MPFCLQPTTCSVYQDLSCLASVDVEMERPAKTTLNSDRGSMYADKPGTSDSWSTAIAKDFVVSSHAEETSRNNMACIQWIGPKPDDSLTRVVSDSDKRRFDNIFDASDSAVTVYDRQTKRRRQDGVSEVEIATGDRVQDAECSSRFPTEIYETIIDYIAEKYHFYSWNNLARCARVCRAWAPRAQMHLFSAINLIPTFDVDDGPLKMTSFWDAARRKPFLLHYIKFLYMTHNSGSPQQTTILSSYHMPNLKQCSISTLDLATVHPSLYRFPSSATSLQILWLDSCKTGDVNHLCRFLTSFRSLYIVTIAWNLGEGNALGGRDLPHLHFNRSKCSLRTLALPLEHNLPALLKTFIKARPFVSHLRHLIVAYTAGFISFISFQDITELLEHCCESLEEVTVIWGHWGQHPLYSLSSFYPSLNLKVPEKYINLFADMVRCLDDILSGERFRSFRKLRIRAEMKPIVFPKLNERKVDVDFSGKEDSISF